MANIYKITAICALLLFAFAGFAQSADEELKEKAETLFNEGQFAEALPIYSQLLSLNNQDPEYNFRFGACQLFVGEDKEGPLKYLGFAVNASNPPALAYFYHGYGLHLNYRFDKAIAQYQKYKEVAGKKERESKVVDEHIKMCTHGKQLVSSFTDISVVQKEVLPRSDFFRNYDLEGFGGKIIVKPDEFMSEEDKKADEKFLMYFQENSNTIYYASRSDKNATGKDLYYIEKLPTGEWSRPRRLSDVLNTPADEDYPFLHPDGKTLYFASKGHNSMGGYDIFKSTMNQDGTWTQPTNMEFAINTPWDDFMFITDEKETSAWFASNRETDNKSVTVYRIGMQRVPLNLTLIKGKFLAEGSKKAKITIEDMVQGKIVGVYESDRQLGDYLLDLRGSGKYKFIVEAEESNLAHTGIVEVPRLKGVNQWAQEMKIVDNNGQEQLQIINLFDEQIADESLLTADILKKQASLDVNSSVEILEAPLATTSGEDQPEDQVMAPEAKKAHVGETIHELESAQKILATKAAQAYSAALEKNAASGPGPLAEAAIATELAQLYQQAADDKSAQIERAKELEQRLLSEEPGSDAFNALYNQFVVSYKDEAETSAKIEGQILETLRSRLSTTEMLAEQKEAEALQVEKDIQSVKEEIAYYQKEKENTKDKAIADELEMQITEANKSLPVKQEALDKARNEALKLKEQSETGAGYLNLAEGLATGIASGTVGISNDPANITMAVLNETEAEILQKASDDLALSVLLTPSQAEIKTREMLAAARMEEVNNVAEVPENDETAEVESTSTEATGRPDMTAQTESNEEPAVSVNGGEAENESKSLNEAVSIAETANGPEPVEGNYDLYFESRLAELSSNTGDPVSTEIERAEIYDRWAVSIQHEISNKQALHETAATPEEKTALEGEITVLKSALAEKQALAASSYAELAALNDQEAMQSEVASDEQETTSDDGAIEVPSPEIAIAEEPVERDAMEANPAALEDNFDRVSQSLKSQIEAASAREEGEPKSRDELRLLQEYANLVSGQLDTLNQLMKAEADPAMKSQYQALALEKAKERNALLQQVREKRNEVAVYEQQEAELEEIRSTAKAVSLPADTVPLSQSVFAVEYLQLQDSYDREKFVEIRERVQAMGGDEKAREERQLQRNWLTAIQIEEARLDQTLQEPTKNAEEKERALVQLAMLKADKSLLRARLSDSPVVLPGTTTSLTLNNAGYIPLAATDAEAKGQEATKAKKEAEDIRDELEALKKKLEGTKKKQERAVVEAEVIAKQQELYTAESYARRLQEQQESLATLDIRLLNLEQDQATPSELEKEKAANLEKEARMLQQEATDVRAEANETKNKKERAAMLAEADSIEARAKARAEEAKMANDFVDNIKELEARTLEVNYLVVPGREVEVPEVTQGLNPTEKQDVAATGEFQQFTREYREAAISYRQAEELKKSAQNIRKQAVATMEQSRSMRSDTAATPESDALALQAVVLYNRADSLDEMAMYMERKGAYLENEANSYLMSLPEQAYMNILAYYSDAPGDEVPVEEVATDQPVVRAEGEQESPPETEDEAVIAEGTATNEPQADETLTEPANNEQLPEAITSTVIEESEGETDLLATEDPINLQAPVVNNTRTDIVPDVLTSTIFDIDRTATTSAYSPSNPIPVDQKMPMGVYYKIQIGAFRNPIQQGAFIGLQPISGETTPNGFTRYTAGFFEKLELAQFALEEVKEIGYPDAFVVAYRDGERVAIELAGQLEGQNQTGSANAVPPATGNATGQRQSTGTGLIKRGDIQIMDVENNQGLFYTVQVGVFSKPVSAEDIFNITPLNQENLPNGTFRYSTGIYPSLEVATQAKEEVVTIGVKDAFVTAYNEGKRITIAEAGQLSGTRSSPSETPSSTQPDTEAETAPVEDVTFRVLLGRFSGEVPLKLAGYLLQLSSDGLVKETDAEGNHKYFLGEFKTQAEAQNKLNEVKAMGFEDAEVVLY